MQCIRDTPYGVSLIRCIPHIPYSPYPIQPIAHIPHIPYSPYTPYTGIPGNRAPDGVPLFEAPEIGPKPHSYIEAPDGHTRDLGPWSPYK